METDEKYIDHTMCIQSPTAVQVLEAKVRGLSLPTVPVHSPQQRETLASDDDDDDGDDGNDANDTDFKPEPAQQENKRKRVTNIGGKQNSKVADNHTKELIDSLQNMHNRSATDQDVDHYFSRLPLDQKKITSLKGSLLKMMQVMHKGSSVTEVKMMEYLSGLTNDEPDKVLEN